jgi:hypothetical protein
MAGTFIISLDFESYWGARDHLRLEDCGANLRGTPRAIAGILDRFVQHGIRATWATVGFLFFASKADLVRGLPELQPKYADSRLSPYPMLDTIGEGETVDPYHFGRSLLAQIRATPGQEIGTHTFSHYYALAAGQTAETFRHDLLAAVRAARTLDLEMRSLVFPRNQTNLDYLGICREAGLTSYRGNPRSWMYLMRGAGDNALRMRAARLLDAYLNVAGHQTYRLEDAAHFGVPFNLPASRFLRPWSERLRGLEAPRLRRIERSMTHAARQGEAFHLWWHPHNFGTHLVRNLANLERILTHFRHLHATYGMESASMGDVASMLLSRVANSEPARA